jgi:hypothetical protein
MWFERIDTRAREAMQGLPGRLPNVGPDIEKSVDGTAPSTV